jgi:hypothetical protein
VIAAAVTLAVLGFATLVVRSRLGAAQNTRVLDEQALDLVLFEASATSRYGPGITTRRRRARALPQVRGSCDGISGGVTKRIEHPLQLGYVTLCPKEFDSHGLERSHPASLPA